MKPKWPTSFLKVFAKLVPRLSNQQKEKFWEWQFLPEPSGKCEIGLPPAGAKTVRMNWLQTTCRREGLFSFIHALCNISHHWSVKNMDCSWYSCRLHLVPFLHVFKFWDFQIPQPSMDTVSSGTTQCGKMFPHYCFRTSRPSYKPYDHNTCSNKHQTCSTNKS